MRWNYVKHGRVSVLGETCDVVGNMSYVGRLEVMGRVEGDLVVSGKVVVGCEACCIGKIRADALEIHGAVHGDVKTKTLKLTSSAQLIGNAVYQKILMAEGATFIKVMREVEQLQEAGLEDLVAQETADTSLVKTIILSEKQLVNEMVEEGPDSDITIVSLEPSHDKKPRFQTVF